MNSLHQELQHLFPGYKSVITSRGISALYLALMAIRAKHGTGEVIVPATVCPSVPLAVMYAGFTPRFCDVELKTFCASKKTIQTCFTDQTKAIIVVYLFGKSIDIKAVKAIAHHQNVAVIEDLAQSIGGMYEEQLLGSFGDFSILSFNDVKIIPGAAGALLFKDDSLLPTIEKYQENLPPSMKYLEYKELSSSFRNLTHGFYDAMRSQNIKSAVDYLPKLAEYYRHLFLFDRNNLGHNLTEQIPALKMLPDEVSRRTKIYKIYESNLRDTIHYVRFYSHEMCWRLPILLKNHSQQIELIERIRSQRILISNHYFPASHLFGDSKPVNARKIGMCAVNFWVDGKTKPDEIIYICQEVNRICG